MTLSSLSQRLHMSTDSTAGAFATCFILRTPLAALVLLTSCAQKAEDGSAWSSKSQSAATTMAYIPEAPMPSDWATSSRPASGSPSGSVETPAAAALTTPADPLSLRARALDIARQGTGASSPLLRAHAIEALVTSPADLDAVVGRGLVDANRGVRFVAAMAIAKAKRVELAHLVEPLLRDESHSVRAAALAALWVAGRSPDLSPLAAYVRSEDPEVRANAYVALGTIGQPSAIPMVRESVGTGFTMADPARVKIVDLQAAECLVRLGRADDIEPIRAALFAPSEQGEVTGLACQMLGRLKDARSRPMLERLVDASGESARPAEIRLAALEALARLGVEPSRVVPLARPFLASADAGQRAQACLVLGATRDRTALSLLEPLLADRDPVVCLAAAAAIVESTTER